MVQLPTSPHCRCLQERVDRLHEQLAQRGHIKFSNDKSVSGGAQAMCLLAHPASCCLLTAPAPSSPSPSPAVHICPTPFSLLPAPLQPATIELEPSDVTDEESTLTRLKSLLGGASKCRVRAGVAPLAGVAGLQSSLLFFYFLFLYKHPLFQ